MQNILNLVVNYQRKASLFLFNWIVMMTAFFAFFFSNGVMKYLRKGLSRVAIVLLALLGPQVALAQVDFMAEIGTQISGGLGLVLSIVRVIVILIMIFAVLYKFSEASRGRATWAEALIPLIAGGVMLAFVAAIEPDATAAIAAIGGGGGGAGGANP